MMTRPTFKSNSFSRPAGSGPAGDFGVMFIMTRTSTPRFNNLANVLSVVHVYFSFGTDADMQGLPCVVTGQQGIDQQAFQ